MKRRLENEDFDREHENSSPPPVTLPPVLVQPQYVRQPVAPNDDPMRFVVPVNPSAWAVAAGYLGLISVLIIPAPIAIIVGILALKDLKRNPNKTGIERAVFGIVMAVGCLLMLSLILYIGTRSSSSR